MSKTKAQLEAELKDLKVEVNAQKAAAESAVKIGEAVAEKLEEAKKKNVTLEYDIDSLVVKADADAKTIATLGDTNRKLYDRIDRLESENALMKSAERMLRWFFAGIIVSMLCVCMIVSIVRLMVPNTPPNIVKPDVDPKPTPKPEPVTVTEKTKQIVEETVPDATHDEKKKMMEIFRNQSKAIQSVNLASPEAARAVLRQEIRDANLRSPWNLFCEKIASLLESEYSAGNDIDVTLNQIAEGLQ